MLDNIKGLLLPRLPGRHYKDRFHLGQQYLLPRQYHILQPEYYSCIEAYYVFFSNDINGLPRNLSVPAWVKDIGDGNIRNHYRGDVFLVKLAPEEVEENG